MPQSRSWHQEFSDRGYDLMIMNDRISAVNMNEQRKFGFPRETIARRILIGAPSELKGEVTQFGGKDRAVAETEEFFRGITAAAPVMIWMSGLNKLCTYFNEGWLRFTGRTLDQELGNGWAEGVHAEDFDACLETYTKAFDLREPFRMEYRLRRHDGEYRWIVDSGVPLVDADGSFAGYIGSAIDITERKLSEEALFNMGQRLIETNEEERARIARELHDQIDSLVLLSIYLDQFLQKRPQSPDETGQRIDEAKEQVKQIVNDIRALACRLHSPQLDYLGLPAAAASFCNEFSKEQTVEIDFQCEGIPKELPQEISVCLYRVLQEALQAANKYRASRLFEVSFAGDPNEITLTIRDWGVGFDPTSASKAHALGMTSMRQRVKLVGGELLIESQAKRGTTVQARVPVRIQTNNRRAEG